MKMSTIMSMMVKVKKDKTHIEKVAFNVRKQQYDSIIKGIERKPNETTKENEE